MGDAMKWLLLIPGVIVAAGAGAYFLGALSPQSHVASREIVLSAAPDRVWQLITDYAAYPSWRPSVKSSTQAPSTSGEMLWTEDYGHMSLTFREEERVEARRLIRRITGEKLDFGGRWIFVLTPEGAGTRLSITEEGEVYGAVYRFFSRYVFGHTRNLGTYLADVKAALG